MATVDSVGSVGSGMCADGSSFGYWSHSFGMSDTIVGGKDIPGKIRNFDKN
jgi:hypothetical protein